MAFTTKQKEAFKWYVTHYPKEKNFYKFSKEFDAELKRIGLAINSAQFVRSTLDELEYPKPELWNPSKYELLVFFDSLPERIRDDNWSVIRKHIGKEEWARYNKKYADAELSFINTIDPEPLMLVEEDKNSNLIFSVYLGDITKNLGITDDDLKHRYDRVYDSIEEELGYASIKKHLPNSIAVLDWPNASVITNAKYEFRVKAQKDPAISDIKNSIVVALNKLGL